MKRSRKKDLVHKGISVLLMIVMLMTFSVGTAAAGEVASSSAGTESEATGEAIPGALAEYNEDSDSFTVVEKIQFPVEMGGSWYELDVGYLNPDNSFVSFPEAISEYSVTLKKDTWKDAVELTSNSEDEEAGKDGVYLDVYGLTEKTPYIGVFTSSDAFAYGNEIYGEYTIGVQWKTATGASYTAQVIVGLVKDEVNRLGKIEILEDGTFIEYYPCDLLQNEVITLRYEPWRDYSGYVAEQYVLSNVEYGVMDFVGSDCTTGLFVPGEPITCPKPTGADAAAIEFTPLKIDYTKLSAEDVGKSYTLTFRSNDGQGVNKTYTLRCEKAGLPADWEVGKLYAIEDYNAQMKDGKVYIDKYTSKLLSELKLRLEGWDAFYFVTVEEDGSLSCENMAEVQENGIKLHKNNAEDISFNGSYEVAPANSTCIGALKSASGEKNIPYSVVLPETGMYSKAEAKEEYYLGSKIHYADEALVKENGTAYAYYLVEYDDYLAQLKEEGKMDICAEDNYGQPISGISLTPQENYIDSESRQEYFVWQMEISQEYEKKEDEGCGIVIYADKQNNEIWRNYWVQIFDSTEISPSQQIYAFYSGDVTVSTDGELTIKPSEEEIGPSKKLNISIGNELDYFFAVKQGDKYIAVNNITVPSTGGIELLTGSTIQEPIAIRTSMAGEYRLSTTVNGKTYYMDVVSKLGIDFYARPEITSGARITGDFHFNSASEKNMEETETYFYVIAPKEGETLTAEIGGYDNQWIWQKKEINGIRIDQYKDLSAEESGIGQACRIWKVTVTKDFRAENNDGSQWINIGVYTQSDLGEENDVTPDSTGIFIYDSTEISEEEQLYCFDASGTTVDDTGKIVLKPAAFPPVLSYHKMVNFSFEPNVLPLSVYFAILKNDGNYYAVEATADSADLGLQKDEDSLQYTVQPTKLGKYQVSATWDGNTYRLNATYSLPEIGFYKTKNRTPEAYAGDTIHFKSAAEKSGDGSEAYFYLFAPKESFNLAEQIKISLRTEDKEHFKGLSFALEKDPYVDTDGKEYLVWKLTITAEFMGTQGYGGNAFTGTISDGENRRSFDINIYGAQEIEEGARLKLLSAEFVTTDQNGKITDTSDLWVSSGTVRELGYQDDYYNHFVVRDDNGDYYLVDDQAKLQEGAGVTMTYEGKGNGYHFFFNSVGRWTVSAEWKGKTYQLYVGSCLPKMGLYAGSTPTEKDFLFNAFNYENAAEEGASSATAYLIVEKGEHTAPPVITVEENTVERKVRTRKAAAKSSMTSDITVGEAQEVTADGIAYYAFPIQVKENYRTYQLNVMATYDDGSSYKTEITFEGKSGGHTITGTVTRYGGQEGTMTLRVLDSDNNEVAQTTTTYGSYELTGIPDGTYTLEISQDKYVTCSMEVTIAGSDLIENTGLFLLGDVNQNGAVDIFDLQRLYEHLNGSNPLQNEAVGDINGKGGIDIFDLQRLYEHLNGSNPLFSE